MIRFNDVLKNIFFLFKIPKLSAKLSIRFYWIFKKVQNTEILSYYTYSK